MTRSPDKSRQPRLLDEEKETLTRLVADYLNPDGTKAKTDKKIAEEINNLHRNEFREERKITQYDVLDTRYQIESGDLNQLRQFHERRERRISTLQRRQIK